MSLDFKSVTNIARQKKLNEDLSDVRNPNRKTNNSASRKSRVTQRSTRVYARKKGTCLFSNINTKADNQSYAEDSPPMAKNESAFKNSFAKIPS